MNDIATNESLTPLDNFSGPSMEQIPCPVRPILFPMDFPWLKDLLLRKYGNNYDVQSTELWFNNVVLRDSFSFLPIRSEGAFLLASLRTSAWLPNEFECSISLLAAHDGCHWQTLPLLRESIAWAKRRRAARWCAYSETDTDYSALMNRIGAIEEPRFTMNLKED